MAIDLIDAHMQLLLAITWQNSQSDGLSRLRALEKMVEQKLNEQERIFPTASERTMAGLQVLQALQEARERLPDSVRPAYSNWTSFPTASDLARLGIDHHDALVPTTQRLISTIRIKMEFRAETYQLKRWLEDAVRSIAKDLGFPLYIPAMVDLALHFALRSKPIEEGDVRDALTGYWVFVLQRHDEDIKRSVRDKIVSELLGAARKIRLHIDQSYSWVVLTMLGARTSLDMLKTYMVLNVHGWITDGHFSPGRVSAKTMSHNQFQKLFTRQFVRGSTLMMSGDDLQTRQLRRSILDTAHGEVRINDRRVSNSLLMLAPDNQDSDNLERLIALFVLKLEHKRRARQPEGSHPFLDIEHLPPLLQQLIAKHGIKRKICNTKKNILFCLAGLLAENIYMYRDRHKTLLANGMPIQFRKDADEYAVSLLSQHGFQYTAESLRRGRARFQRAFLKRVPGIFGLDAPQPDGWAFDASGRN